MVVVYSCLHRVLHSGLFIQWKLRYNNHTEYSKSTRYSLKPHNIQKTNINFTVATFAHSHHPSSLWRLFWPANVMTHSAILTQTAIASVVLVTMCHTCTASHGAITVVSVVIHKKTNPTSHSCPLPAEQEHQKRQQNEDEKWCHHRCVNDKILQFAITRS
jgi:hypothetical protein